LRIGSRFFALSPFLPVVMFVQGDTSGDYRKILLALIGEA
jgi:hypothetical protein